VKLLGLKPDKWRQWREVLKIERKEVSWLAMGFLALKMPFVSRRLARQRYRTCYRCPIFNMELRRCRPFTGSAAGCGCWVVLLVRAYFSNKGCWAVRNLPEGSGYGWKK
jgi:hypothetical protein